MGTVGRAGMPPRLQIFRCAATGGCPPHSYSFPKQNSGDRRIDIEIWRGVNLTPTITPGLDVDGVLGSSVCW